MIRRGTYTVPTRSSHVVHDTYNKKNINTDAGGVSYLGECAFYSNFSITVPGFLISLRTSAYISHQSSSALFLLSCYQLTTTILCYTTSLCALPAVCVVFTSNRSFYPMTSVNPEFVLILHPTYSVEIQILWPLSSTR